ncbi:hypothetical protein T01_12697 [Trichinella spiralis]|uniref:Uncharacterized protein n=1 Tax=Trichinella spiralis TaxID=6334 RepID=A0A0V1BW68_TRISP|nr:hypothetical protein T01_12697 [Trichinella spiralis]
MRIRTDQHYSSVIILIAYITAFFSTDAKFKFIPIFHLMRRHTASLHVSEFPAASASDSFHNILEFGQRIGFLQFPKFLKKSCQIANLVRKMQIFLDYPQCETSSTLTLSSLGGTTTDHHIPIHSNIIAGRLIKNVDGVHRTTSKLTSVMHFASKLTPELESKVNSVDFDDKLSDTDRQSKVTKLRHFSKAHTFTSDGLPEKTPNKIATFITPSQVSQLNLYESMTSTRVSFSVSFFRLFQKLENKSEGSHVISLDGISAYHVLEGSFALDAFCMITSRTDIFYNTLFMPEFLLSAQ